MAKTLSFVAQRLEKIEKRSRNGHADCPAAASIPGVAPDSKDGVRVAAFGPACGLCGRCWPDPEGEAPLKAELQAARETIEQLRSELEAARAAAGGGGAAVTV